MMTPGQLKGARLDRGWNQREAAARLRVTQAYLSMLESGRRDMTPLSRKLVKVYGLPPTALPLEEVSEGATADLLARELASLGYPGFVHLRRNTRWRNPANFLLTALLQRNLEARVAEGLPWLVMRYPDMPRDWLVREARARALQNRLGFVVTLSRLAGRRDDLRPLELELADSKLAKEDSFCRELNEAERHWLRANRSQEAKQWNLLSDMRPETVRYAL